MTASELINNDIPALQATDTVRQALDLMEEYRISELPVVDQQKYLGLITENEAQNADERSAVSALLHTGSPVKINPVDFFFVPLRVMHQQQIGLLPVVKDDGDLLGVITKNELLHAAANYTAAQVPGGIIILQINPSSFYISEIGRIVESNNARIIHLNTWTDPSTGELMVAIKVNKSDIQDILASFERYEYNVVRYFGENLSEEELRLNYDHLMNYLNI